MSSCRFVLNEVDNKEDEQSVAAVMYYGCLLRCERAKQYLFWIGVCVFTSSGASITLSGSAMVNISVI